MLLILRCLEDESCIPGNRHPPRRGRATPFANLPKIWARHTGTVNMLREKQFRRAFVSHSETFSGEGIGPLKELVLLPKVPYFRKFVIDKIIDTSCTAELTYTRK